MSLEVKSIYDVVWHTYAEETGKIGVYDSKSQKAYFTKNKTLAAKLIKLLKMEKVGY